MINMNKKDKLLKIFDYIYVHIPYTLRVSVLFSSEYSIF
jgi:hypothetical protein